MRGPAAVCGGAVLLALAAGPSFALSSGNFSASFGSTGWGFEKHFCGKGGEHDEEAYQDRVGGAGWGWLGERRFCPKQRQFQLLKRWWPDWLRAQQQQRQHHWWSAMRAHFFGRCPVLR